MIITKTPFRMSFFGGGTDMELYFREYGGAVLSTTFDKGVLTCFISSSLVRNQLYFQRDVLVHKINEFLAKDELFESAEDGSPAVKILVLK